MMIGSHDVQRRVLIVAEIGNNHEGDVALAKDMIHAAAQAGADAVKFQTIVPERFVRASQVERMVQLQRFALSYEEFTQLKTVADETGVLFLSTPFDLESVAFLNGLVPAFKIASGDNTFYPLLQAIAQTGKPAILSTGLADLEQVRSSMRRFELEGGAGALAILHCVTSYPTLPEQANLSAIRTLKDAFPHNSVGYSDHTMGIRAAVASVALGARIIEKHFTIDKQFSDFHDHQLSADPEELTEMVLHIRELETMLGTGEKVAQEGEENNRIGGRRSIVSKRSLRAGETVTLEDLTWMRPGDGMPPGDEHLLLGKRLTAPLQVGEPFSLEIVE